MLMCLLALAIAVWFPAMEETFGIWYYIGGVAGLFPGGVYGDLMTKVAAHGYVVIAVWPLSSADPLPDFSPEAHMANIEWVCIYILPLVLLLNMMYG